MLNIKCLEAAFYTCASTGQYLDPALTRNGPLPTSCVQANVTSGIASITDELMREEVSFLTAIVNALRAVGESPQCPYMNLDSVFEDAAANAVSAPSFIARPNVQSFLKNPTFDSRADDSSFLAAAFYVEDTTASELLHIATKITDPQRQLLYTRAGEAQSAQSALIRLLAYQQKEAVTSLGITLKDLLTGLADYKNTLANKTWVFPIEGQDGAGAANVDTRTMVPAITLNESTPVYFLGSPDFKGGFFPDGLVA